jgi:1-acyl-sn-glycerol-3-phosphate acyltransferase
MSLTIGPQLPRRGNACSRWLGRVVLRAMGWRLQGAVPNLPQMVLIGAPHTTNMDGVIGITTLIALGLRAGTMIKDSAFKGLLGGLLRWLGAIPVNRKSPKGVVEQSVDAFANSPKLLLLIAPEGTRYGTAEWKRGYYLIASKAGVPVLPAAADYQSKIITFGPPLVPTGDYAADFAVLLKFYAEHGRARHPQRLSKPLCEASGQVWTQDKES